MDLKEIAEQLQESKEILQAIEEIPLDKFLTCKEYNTILLRLVGDSYEYNKNKEEYDLILEKLFNISIIEVEKLLTVQEIRQEQIKKIEAYNKPITNKPIIN